jgi:predicted metal-dependent HD superfamily phosphohydrolase
MQDDFATIGTGPIKVVWTQDDIDRLDKALADRSERRRIKEMKSFKPIFDYTPKTRELISAGELEEESAIERLNFLGPEFTEIFYRANRYYESGVNGYHDINHAENVVETSEKLFGCKKVSLILAAKWHDAVYFGTGEFNEYLSAKALIAEAQAAGISKGGESFEIIHEAAELIRNTTIGHHLDITPRTSFNTKTTSFLLDVLLDADLTELAVEYETFVDNQLNIINEGLRARSGVELYSTPEPSDSEGMEHFHKCAAFLGKFLERPNIYRTKQAQQTYQNKAIANILKFRTRYLKQGS